jgi:hypothetical protein
MTYDEFKEHVSRLRSRYSEGITVVCPDGISRNVWGYNEQTGDVFVKGWDGDVFIDASDRDNVGVEFK